MTELGGYAAHRAADKDDVTKSRHPTAHRVACCRLPEVLRINDLDPAVTKSSAAGPTVVLPLRGLIRHLLAPCLLLATLIATPAAASTLVAELLAGRFESLEQQLSARDGASDRALQRDLETLAQLSPPFREARAAWARARPDSPWPLLGIGLAEDRAAEAWLEGGPWHALPPARRRAVLRAWESAATAYEAALALDPSLGPAHAGLLRLERAGASGRSARALFERARLRAGASWSVLDEMLKAATADTGASRRTLEYLHGVTRRAVPRHADFRALAAGADCALIEQEEAFDPDERRQALLEVPGVGDSAYCQEQLAALARSAGDAVGELAFLLAAQGLEATDRRRLRIAARRAIDAGPAPAREELAASIDRHGPTPASLRRLASLHWQLGEDADALRLLGLAVVWFPLDEAAWALRGQLLARQPDQLEAAAQSLATALRLNPASVETWAEWLRLQSRLPCPAASQPFAGSCAAWGCPDRVRRDPALNALARQLERRCG